jgi:hypothetical protein
MAQRREHARRVEARGDHASVERVGAGAPEVTRRLGLEAHGDAPLSLEPPREAEPNDLLSTVELCDAKRELLRNEKDCGCGPISLDTPASAAVT